MSLDSHEVESASHQPTSQDPTTHLRSAAPVSSFATVYPAAVPRAEVSADDLAAALRSSGFQPTARPSSDPGRFRRWRVRQSVHLLITDVLVLGAAASVTAVGTGAAASPQLWDTAGTAFLLLLWLVSLALAGGYRVRGVQVRCLVRPILTTGAGLVGTAALLGLLADWQPSRELILYTVPAGLLGLLAVRLGWHLILRRNVAEGPGRRRVVVIGESSKARHVHRELVRGADASGYQVAEILTWSHDHADSDSGQLPGAGAVAEARDAVLTSGADLVVLAGADVLDAGAVRALAWELAELDVELATASGLCDVAGWRLRSESVQGLAMVHVGLPRLRGLSAAYKRLFDIVFASVALVLLAPFLLLTSAAVKLDSRGPALFRQQRVGLDHSRFTMLKFRSMTVDAEVRRTELLHRSEGNEMMFKMRHDPRVTRLGAVLRRFSIDELPQFLNVLSGEMSVVGPRPPLPSETDSYDDRADRRLIVKPGITGLWQVHGRSDLSWEESLRLDLYYVENWSPGTDLQIVLRTLWAVLYGKGAY